MMAASQNGMNRLHIAIRRLLIQLTGDKIEGLMADRACACDELGLMIVTPPVQQTKN
jgi:hypothetical protein